MVPPPWEEFTTREPSRRATAGQAAGHDPGFAARQYKRTQVDMAWRDAAFDKGRTGRQRQRRLCDVGMGLGDDARAEGFDFRGALPPGPTSIP